MPLAPPLRTGLESFPSSGSSRAKTPRAGSVCHTPKGKRAGKTKADFFREEQRALKPFQPGLFDDLPANLSRAD